MYHVYQKIQSTVVNKTLGTLCRLLRDIFILSLFFHDRDDGQIGREGWMRIVVSAVDARSTSSNFTRMILSLVREITIYYGSAKVIR